MTPVSRLFPYIVALVVGVAVGAAGRSPILAGVVACMVSVAWALYDNRA